MVLVPPDPYARTRPFFVPKWPSLHSALAQKGISVLPRSLRQQVMPLAMPMIRLLVASRISQRADSWLGQMTYFQLL